MRVKNKLLLSILTAVMCALCLSVSTFAIVDSSDTHRISFSLSFNSGKATCYVKIVGADGTDSFSNWTVTLTDDDDSTYKKTWSGSNVSGDTLTVTKTASGAITGHTYTLSVTATVHRNGNTETVSDSFTSTYVSG